jgi:MSHA biogenesis protein MshQ
VGSITLGGVDPAGSYGATNYLGMSGLHVPILSDVIGRFVPHHFTVTAAVANACPAGSITYMGQPFTFSQPGVVEARNAGEVITQNYRDDGVAANDYAPGTVNFGAENADNGTDLSGRLAFYSAATYPALTGSWAGGVYTLTGNDTAAAFTRPTAIVPDSTWGSFDSLDLGLTVIDNDVATSPRVSGADMNPATTGSASLTYKKFSGGPLRMRYGRLVLQNAFGPETENHRMRLLAQYYNVDAFVANAEDTCSNYNAASLTCGNLIGPVACGDVTVGGANISHGQFFTLSAPNKIGTLLYTLTVAPWLLYEWDGAGNDFNENPFARANFGIYRGNDRIINWREIIR